MYNDKEIEEILKEKCGIEPGSVYVNKEDLICSCKAVTDNLTDMMTGILEKQDEKVQIAQGNIDAIYKAFGDKPIVPQGLSSMSAKNPGLPPLKTEESDEASVTNMLATKTISIVMAGVTVGVAAVALAIWVVDYKTRKAGINSGKVSKAIRDTLQKIRGTYGVAKLESQVKANLGVVGLPSYFEEGILKGAGYADEKGNWIKFEGESFREYGIAEIKRFNANGYCRTLSDGMFTETVGCKKELYFDADILPAELSFWLVKLGYLTEENHSFVSEDKKNEFEEICDTLNNINATNNTQYNILDVIYFLIEKGVPNKPDRACELLSRALSDYNAKIQSCSNKTQNDGESASLVKGVVNQTQSRKNLTVKKAGGIVATLIKKKNKLEKEIEDLGKEYKTDKIKKKIANHSAEVLSLNAKITNLLSFIDINNTVEAEEGMSVASPAALLQNIGDSEKTPMLPNQHNLENHLQGTSQDANKQMSTNTGNLVDRTGANEQGKNTNPLNVSSNLAGDTSQFEEVEQPKNALQSSVMDTGYNTQPVPHLVGNDQPNTRESVLSAKAANSASQSGNSRRASNRPGRTSASRVSLQNAEQGNISVEVNNTTQNGNDGQSNIHLERVGSAAQGGGVQTVGEQAEKLLISRRATEEGNAQTAQPSQQ